ncbi:methyltransferase domain-containing protein [Candidatus Pacearchaeota archaeon]|nr:methyltransferase domain-containing protein [Candidatus Pacearchaeota archaeon]
MTIPIKIISRMQYLENNAKPNQEQIWDVIAKPWRTYVQKKIPLVVEFLKNKRGKIIDLGCGSGRNMIKNKEIEYYGLDFSKKQIENAALLTAVEDINVLLFQSAVDKLDKDTFKDEMFDHGLFMATLHCLETEQERLNSLKELYRILKNGAQAMISVWSSDDKRFKGLKGDIYMSWREENVPYMRSYYLYDKQELIDLLKSVGFEILQFYESLTDDRFSRKNWILRIKK